jgi:hypothetical protein
MRLHQRAGASCPDKGAGRRPTGAGRNASISEVHMSSVASLPILASIGIFDENSLLRRYVKYWLIYQVMPVPVLLLGWYELRIGGAAHLWFWPLVLSVHFLLSFACAFQAALFHGRAR